MRLPIHRDRLDLASPRQRMEDVANPRSRRERRQKCLHIRLRRQQRLPKIKARQRRERARLPRIGARLQLLRKAVQHRLPYRVAAIGTHHRQHPQVLPKLVQRPQNRRLRHLLAQRARQVGGARRPVLKQEVVRIQRQRTHLGRPARRGQLLERLVPPQSKHIRKRRNRRHEVWRVRRRTGRPGRLSGTAVPSATSRASNVRASAISASEGAAFVTPSVASTNVGAGEPISCGRGANNSSPQRETNCRAASRVSTARLVSSAFAGSFWRQCGKRAAAS